MSPDQAPGAMQQQQAAVQQGARPAREERGEEGAAAAGREGSGGGRRWPCRRLLPAVLAPGRGARPGEAAVRPVGVPRRGPACAKGTRF